MASAQPQHTREELIYLSKLAEQCERYDGKVTFNLQITEMVEYTK